MQHCCLCINGITLLFYHCCYNIKVLTLIILFFKFSFQFYVVFRLIISPYYHVNVTPLFVWSYCFGWGLSVGLSIIGCFIHCCLFPYMVIYQVVNYLFDMFPLLCCGKRSSKVFF